MTLDGLPLQTRARIRSIDWARLPERDGRRLRELGFDEGVAIEPRHVGGAWARDPLAVRIGRMTVAIRRVHAAAIEVDPA